MYQPPYRFRASFLLFILISLAGLAKAPSLTLEELLLPPPRIIRTCCSFGSNLSVARIPFVTQTDITSIDAIGPHHYLGHKSEGNGIIYTRHGGFIDLGHLRDCADWTAYLYNQIISHPQNGEPILIDLGSEGGPKTLSLNLPDFDNALAYELAGKIAYDLSVWHEIATWFGASYIPLIPERYSSFSPEDLYSNLLGVKLAIQALKSELDYNEAMTTLLAGTLAELEAVPTLAETYNAMEEVENLWWTRKKPIPSKDIILTRYMGNGPALAPWLVPKEAQHATPYVLKKPEANLSDFYELKIKLNHKFPLKELIAVPADRFISQKDFDYLISYIEGYDSSAQL